MMNIIRKRWRFTGNAMAKLISIICNEVSGGWSPKSKRLGGTEESIVEWAKQFSKKHEVKVYHNGEHGTYDGVKYLSRGEYEGGKGLTLNVKSSEIAPQEKTWYFTNETDATDRDLSKYEGVIWPSQWAKDNIPVNNKNVKVVPHGYDPKEIYPEDKIPKMCLYASSPDRGLSEVLQAWPYVHEAHPDAQLVLTYGVEESNFDGVMAMGEVDAQMMAEIYRKSDIWVHPCNGGELFGITAVKAQVAGCIPVYYPTMALNETVKRGVVCTPHNFTQSWIDILDDTKFKSKIREELAEQDYPDWEKSANLLLEVMNGRK